MEKTPEHKNKSFYVIAPNTVWRWMDVNSNSIKIKILISSFILVTGKNANFKIRAIRVFTDAKMQS